MKIVVIGGTGHIGTYLIPRLIRARHEVSVVTRRAEPRYAEAREPWDRVRWIVADRLQEETDGTWAARMKEIDADVVIDLICYRLEQQKQSFAAFNGRIQHFLQCGTAWAYGPSDRAPYEEQFERRPITTYGSDKLAVERYLLEMYHEHAFPCTVIHPGHISGRAWLPIDPQGTRDGVEIYRRLATGATVLLPEPGMATLHHVHADDLAQLFEAAIENPNQSVGEVFSAGAPYALTLAGCCRHVAAQFGRQANLSYLPLAEFVRHMSDQAAQIVQTHIEHSPCLSIGKAQRMLGYAPKYTIERIYDECIERLVESQQLRMDSE